MDALTVEARTSSKVEKLNDRLVRDFGYGATAGGVRLSEKALKPLAEHIDTYEAKRLRSSNKLKPLLLTIKNLSSSTIALCILQNAIHSMALDHDTRRTVLGIGYGLSSECWALGLLNHDPDLGAGIAKRVKKRHGNQKYRRQAARSIAKRWGYTSRQWTKEEIALVGGWGLDSLLKALPDLFVLGADNRPTMTQEALEVVEAAMANDFLNNAVPLPLQEPPVPWSDYNVGGYSDPLLKHRVQLLRTFSKEAIAAVRGAIKDGTMTPALNALNRVQGTAWKINERVLEVVQACYDQDIRVPGLPSRRDMMLLPRPDDWETLHEDRKRAWRKKASRVRELNRGLVSERVLFADDMATARHLQGRPFWTPCSLDWRGRVYSVPHFNFQRDDRVRAMFLFNRGAPVGEDGLWWLKVHVANCGDFDKISKRSLEERVKWVDDNIEWLKIVAVNPFDAHSWTQADKPFLFLAAVIELVEALTYGPNYETHLPLSFDGSCSGLQHLSAMTRASEGALVNLTASSEPQDVYDAVASRVVERIKADTVNQESARLCLAYGINRKSVKRNVMTYPYSSKKFGMAEQQMEDLMRPLGLEVLSGDLEQHPFRHSEDEYEEGATVAKYLASHAYESIEAIVEKPAQAMAFLQRCARALAHEGKPLSWTTPAGLPWSNRYHVPMIERVELWLSDVRVTINLAVGDQKQIDKDKVANGAPPNFVHACDAAHLMLTVNAAWDEGIKDTATVHDSFGCLAPYAARFNQIIREQFVRMYEENDVLNQVLERAKCDLTVHNRQRLPEMVQKGPLNLQEVLNARYAFA